MNKAVVSSYSLRALFSWTFCKIVLFIILIVTFIFVLKQQAMLRVIPRSSVVLEAEGVFAACTDVTEDEIVWMARTN